MRRGGVILYPTDTIWGNRLRCHQRRGCPSCVRHQEARRQQGTHLPGRLRPPVAALRKRPFPSVAGLDRICHPSAHHHFRQGQEPGPQPAGRRRRCRHPRHREEFSRQLCYRFQKAVVSTSANVSGEPSPACFDDISDEIKNAVDYIVQSRRKEKTKAVPQQYHQTGFGRRSSHYQEISRKNHVRGKKNFTFFERLFIWRRMNFSEQKFILMISFVVGVLTAFAGLFLKWLIHQIQYLPDLPFRRHRFQRPLSGVSVIGIFLTGLFVRYVVRTTSATVSPRFSLPSHANRVKSRRTTHGRASSPVPLPSGSEVP